jgi:hypothetical protein
MWAWIKCAPALGRYRPFQVRSGRRCRDPLPPCALLPSDPFFRSDQAISVDLSLWPAVGRTQEDTLRAGRSRRSGARRQSGRVRKRTGARQDHGIRAVGCPHLLPSGEGVGCRLLGSRWPGARPGRRAAVSGSAIRRRAPDLAGRGPSPPGPPRPSPRAPGWPATARWRPRCPGPGDCPRRSHRSGCPRRSRG